jgi:carbamoyltransferase
MNSDDNSAGKKFYEEYWNPKNYDIYAFTTTVGGMNQIPSLQILKNDINWWPKKLWDYKMLDDNLYYIDHHQSHAAYAYLLSEYEQSDILAIDGRGWKYNCIFIDKDKNIVDLSKEMNIGILWNFIAKELGFGNLGASKVMGLAAYGSYREDIHMILDRYWDNDKKWKQKFKEVQEKIVLQEKIKQSGIKCDIARTLQVATEEKIRDHIYPLKTSDNICVSGGVAYNGYVNEMLYENWSSVYVPPAAGDEGQSIGTYMHANYVLNKQIHKPSVYAGKEYSYKDGKKINLKEVAQAIANGKIIGWFQGKSESGHRALGNRSILADPRNPNIKDIINKEIKIREDFRPFAPSVLEEHYDKWFNTPEPSPHMSRIVKVKKPKDVPGITHVDGTARIQTVNKKQNQKYYNLINEFYKITGVPMLLNTSFNCREPIVETPREAINTFNNTELDMVVINGRYLSKVG